ncbi:MAG TPA: hypothetical protein VHW66_22305 [Stellaceae bacterium]|jgi:hypothetical protein|nr:hypothetical protein [Stellaceae bacterium]
MNITEKDGTKETIGHPELLKYEKFVVPAILAIQSLKTADDARDEEIAGLKADNDNLRSLVTAQGRAIEELREAQTQGIHFRMYDPNVKSQGQK